MTAKKTVRKSKPVSISASSRASVKIGDSYYTVEFKEEWAIEDGADMKAERKALWDTVNGECDSQIEDIIRELGH